MYFSNMNFFTHMSPFPGKPIPAVRWYMENSEIESHSTSSDGKVVISKIDIPNVSRSFLNRTYTCQAKNTELISPYHRTVRVELHRKFRYVQLNLAYKYRRRRLLKKLFARVLPIRVLIIGISYYSTRMWCFCFFSLFLPTRVAIVNILLVSAARIPLSDLTKLSWGSWRAFFFLFFFFLPRMISVVSRLSETFFLLMLISLADSNESSSSFNVEDLLLQQK